MEAPEAGLHDAIGGESEIGIANCGIVVISVQGTGCATVAATIDDLPSLFDRYAAQYLSSTYKTNFGFIDNIAEVRDPAKRAALDSALVKRLQTLPIDRLWLSIPDIVDWSKIGGFKFTRREKTAHPDLHVRDFLATIADKSKLTVELLHSRRILVLDADGDQELDAWPVYSSLYCEYDVGNETFLLTGGKWYRIEKNFVAEVNKAVAALAATTPTLPAYETTDLGEGAYNARVAKDSGGVWALMDQKNIPIGGGHSTVELCDLYGRSGELVHVKRYGGSSAPLSHQFFQGLVAAQSWISDAEFRRKANALLPKAHKLADSSRKPDPSKHPVVFAVVSRSAKSIDKSLPFFSRLALRNTARQLELMGFRVTLLKIKQP